MVRWIIAISSIRDRTLIVVNKNAGFTFTVKSNCGILCNKNGLSVTSNNSAISIVSSWCSCMNCNLSILEDFESIFSIYTFAIMVHINNIALSDAFPCLSLSISFRWLYSLRIILSNINSIIIVNHNIVIDVNFVYVKFFCCVTVCIAKTNSYPRISVTWVLTKASLACLVNYSSVFNYSSSLISSLAIPSLIVCADIVGTISNIFPEFSVCDWLAPVVIVRFYGFVNFSIRNNSDSVSVASLT